MAAADLARPPRCCRCGGKVEAEALGASDVFEGLYQQTKTACKALAGRVGDLQTELEELQEKYAKLKKRYKREREEWRAGQALQEHAGTTAEGDRRRADAAERKLADVSTRHKDLLHRYRDALRAARDEANAAAVENTRLQQALVDSAAAAAAAAVPPAPPSPTASSLEHEAELSREWRNPTAMTAGVGHAHAHAHSAARGARESRSARQRSLTRDTAASTAKRVTVHAAGKGNPANHAAAAAGASGAASGTTPRGGGGGTRGERDPPPPPLPPQQHTPRSSSSHRRHGQQGTSKPRTRGDASAADATPCAACGDTIRSSEKRVHVDHARVVHSGCRHAFRKPPTPRGDAAPAGVDAAPRAPAPAPPAEDATCAQCGGGYRAGESRVEVDAQHSVHKRCRYGFMKAQKERERGQGQGTMNTTTNAPATPGRAQRPPVRVIPTPHAAAAPLDAPASAAHLDPAILGGTLSSTGDDYALPNSPPAPHPYTLAAYPGGGGGYESGRHLGSPSSPAQGREASINADLMQLEQDLADLQRSLLS